RSDTRSVPGTMTIIHHPADVKAPLNMFPPDARPTQANVTPIGSPAVMKWLTYDEVAVQCTNEKAAQEKEDLRTKELAKRMRQKRNIRAALIIGLALLVGTILGWIALWEAHRTHGMTFSVRHESFPLVLPGGNPRLRTVGGEISNMRRGLKGFTPFIATTQETGKVTILTNLTSPSYSAYYVKHPEIYDVVMIIDNLFCSPKTCFYLPDVNNDAFFKTPEYRPSEPHDFTYQVVKVPLPADMTFVKAEYCQYLMSRRCRILMKSSSGVPHFGMVIMNASSIAPTINNTGIVKPWLTRAPVVEFRAFRTLDERIVYWYDNKLAVVRNFRNKVIIDDVDRDEVVELLDIGTTTDIVIVMKEEEGGTTRVRIYAISNANKLVHHDEIRLSSPPSAITILARDYTFEICGMAEGARLTCYTNKVEKEKHR
ncbi:hypothetical protein PENTCL1PPCAC_291, partial [Pristionchus entomophagus]